MDAPTCAICASFGDPPPTCYKAGKAAKEKGMGQLLAGTDGVLDTLPFGKSWHEQQ